MRVPRYDGLSPRSAIASAAARGSSRKAGTTPERLLRLELWSRGLRYRKNVPTLLGKPDLVFYAARVVVFVDGDFWHGRSWKSRRAKLQRGHNSAYWVAKIQRNIDRDRAQQAALEAEGWLVLRFWESDVRRRLPVVVRRVEAVVVRRRSRECPARTAECRLIR